MPGSRTGIWRRRPLSMRRLAAHSANTVQKNKTNTIQKYKYNAKIQIQFHHDGDTIAIEAELQNVAGRANTLCPIHIVPVRFGGPCMDQDIVLATKAPSTAFISFYSEVGTSKRLLNESSLLQFNG